MNYDIIIIIIASFYRAHFKLVKNFNALYIKYIILEIQYKINIYGTLHLGSDIGDNIIIGHIFYLQT